MKLAKNFSKAYSTKYLAALTILSGLEAFVGALEGLYPQEAAVATAILSGIGLVLRALPQDDEKGA
jgi:hypothetical protein